jgi:hypothetical protein
MVEVLTVAVPLVVLAVRDLDACPIVRNKLVETSTTTMTIARRKAG